MIDPELLSLRVRTKTTDLDVLHLAAPTAETPHVELGFGGRRDLDDCVDDLLQTLEDILLQSLDSGDASTRRRRLENAVVLLQQATACLDPQRRPPGLQPIAYEPWMDDRLELDVTIARQLRRELSAGPGDAAAKWRESDAELLMDRLHKALTNQAGISEHLLRACLGFVINSLEKLRRE